MANYTSTANVVLSVNGKQAQKMLSTLEKDAQRLEKQLAKAATAGDKATMKKLQRELTSTRKLIDQMKGSAASVEQVLNRLDKATPKELNKALKQLQQQLNGIERGSAAWDAHVAKIKAVKAELSRVNQTLQTQRSLWDRMNIWLNNCQTALLGIGAAITGLVMAGRKAVNAYAEMEQEMANVRKFTGMTADEVASLNEEFKKMDTRSSREELNRLAQEAGRLGKTSQEDVLGFVRAADKINVALDDLGDGATLTLSKLTGIFGDEERLGTEQALLSVGSVINELSQNCSASAPYIAEFASRMGGVGAQANMTVQQIMGFAAVLDSNNQKLEASSTALSQVIVRIYQDPAKYARVAGIEVEKFSRMVKEDMNGALIYFLETLNKAGNMDVLSPMFKDMGENGSRAISALSTLANNIDAVKSQQEVANIAFAEAISIDKEFDVQNNTVQAGLDKAKKRVNELAIELGQKLLPIMRYVISSSTIFLKALSALVDFVIKNRVALLSLIAAFLAYTVAVNASNIALKLHYAWLVVTQKGMALLQGTSILLRMTFYALTGQINKAKSAYIAFSMLTKVSPFGILIAGISAAIIGLTSWINKNKEAKKAQEEERRALEQQAAAMRDISESSATYAKNEMTQLKALYEAATDEAKSKDERTKAAQRLQQLYPEYFGQLKTEAILVGSAKSQYEDLTIAIIASARARAAAAKIEENEGKLLELEMQNEQLTPQLTTAVQRRDAAKRDLDAVKAQEREKMNSAALGDVRESNSQVRDSRRAIAPYQTKYDDAQSKVTTLQDEINANQRQIDQLTAANRELAEKYNVSAETLAANETQIETPKLPPGNTPVDTPTVTDRFAVEKDWRESMEASARISYAVGESDYVAYTKRMDEIAVGYYEKLLMRTDLGETERLTITAQWREAQRKQQEHFNAQSIDAENAAYNEKLANLKQMYINGEIDKAAYDLKIEEAEIEHQQTLVNLAVVGSKERLQAEARLSDLLIAQMQRQQSETQKLEQKYAQMKKDYFGDNPQETESKYNADMAALDVVYQRELAAAGNNADEKLRIEEAYQKAKLVLQKKYGKLAEADNRNRAQRMTDDFVEWLDSDGGKAVTGTIDTLVSGMSAIFSQLSSIMQADLQIQTAAINKRYDAEISRAEGNSYQVAKLEKEKEAAIAKAKNEANRKMFAMQVIQAVAQTATNAIAAYGSAAAIPVVGFVMAPIAAAMAVAAGMLQIAAIKKQQQASEAQGYSDGGFTPDGDKNTAVGVVHAGEWVASQKLTRNPQVRPLLEALDYAQRNNAIGSLTHSAVSAMMPTSAAITRQSTQSVQPNVVVNVPSNSSDNSELTATLTSLRDRLSEPFVTINTVSGDHGIQQAQDEYDRLLKNKSPKSKR